jgi:membrane protein required for colicin V production
MSWIDIGILVMLAASVAWGVWRGLVRELLSLLGWVIAFLCANLFAGPLSETVTSVMQPELRVLFSWLGIFVVVLMITTLGGMLLAKVIKAAGLASTDRWLGALFGLTRGLIIALAFAILAGLTRLPLQPAWKESFFGAPLANTVVQLKPWLPPQLAQRLRYH